MNTAPLHTNSGSIYGQRVEDAAATKKRVADAVVQNILWQRDFDPTNPVFISDGSSSSYVFYSYMLAYLAKPQDELLNIWTNNLDVPIQLVCQKGASEKVSIEVASGHFRHRYCGTFGSATEAWVEKNCDGSTCILAVTGLDAELGPSANDPDAKKLKAAVMRAARQLIIVADASKLRKKRNDPAAVSPNEWHRWCSDRSERVFVVTDRSTHFAWLPGTAFVLRTGAVDSRTPDQIEQENHRLLKLKLGNHFIVV